MPVATRLVSRCSGIGTQLFTLMHTEVAARELHAKLLLAVVAASRGHVAVVADLGTLMRAVGQSKFFRRNLFPGAIFHTKSLTPSFSNIERNKELIARGLVVTSQDEEAGLQTSDYESFALARFSAESIGQSGALFTWGQFDDLFLRTRFPQHAEKIFLTGSPRADLWHVSRTKFLLPPDSLPTRPFLLVASTMGFPFRPPQLSFKMAIEAGYYLRDPHRLARRFDAESEKLKLMYKFIEAVRLLSKDGRYDVVLRPHPVEDLHAWEMFFTDFPNVYVIREGTITQWVHHAFAVLHNGCTTALEAVIAKKPVVAYVPFEREYGALANSLGDIAKTPEGLVETVGFHFGQFGTNSGRSLGEIPAAVRNRVLVDENQLAAEKIVKVWEELSGHGKDRHFPWLQLCFMGLVYRILGLGRRRPSAGKKMRPQEKFPRQNFEEISRQVNRFASALNVDGGIQVRRIHDRCFVVSPRKNRRTRKCCKTWRKGR